MRIFEIRRLSLYYFPQLGFGRIPTYCGCLYFELGPFVIEVAARGGCDT